MIIFSLLAVMTASGLAQTKNDMVVLEAGNGSWVPIPSAEIDKKTKKSVVHWNRTEKDDWFEPSDLVLEKVPTINNFDELLTDLDVGDPIEDVPYMSMPWRLTEENGETVLHCYFRMPADIVDNFWLTDEEGCILDKETGISYRARRTEPDCYYKRFGIKGKKGDILDFKIFFPKLPESVREVAIYGVPNWYLRGWNVTLNRGNQFYGVAHYYDTIPEFHHPTQIVEAKNYDKDNFFTWSEYKDAHLIKPIPEGTMAMWLTPEATYVAISTEMNWRREYFGRGGNTILIDKSGHQYKCKDVIDYPDDTLFWVQGYSGDYFAIVLVFEPLPLTLESITYIEPEGEPFKANFANWSGEVKTDLSIKELRQNQKLFEYFPRKMVE
jgi:hypothetical protein